MKTDYPSSRGRRSSPELFTHNLALIHMKQARQSSRFPRSNSLLVCCAFVALMGITILSMGNIAHAQGTLVTNVDQPYTWYDDHGQKGLDLPDELDVITDQFLEIEVDIPPWVTVVGAWVAAVAGGTYGGIGGAAIGAIIGAAVVELSEELTDLQLESAQEALREFLEDVEDTYDTHTIPYGIWNGTLAQEFTTGSNGYGYDLSSVGIYGRFYPDNAINFPASISIWSGPYTPVAHLYTLPFAKSVNDGSHGLRLVYQPESPATLEPDTRYVIFVGHVENSRVVVTSSGNEDAGASPGWSIKNDLAEKSGDLWRLVTPEDAGRKVFPADALPVLRIGIEGSLLDSNTIIVSLTNVGEGQFKATATTSAPSDIILPIAVINGTIESGATTVTIPAGSAESDVINVSRIPGTTFPVSVDIGNLPSPPTGYSLFKSPSRLPLQVLEGLSGSITPVSERTPQVRDAIVAAVRGINSANDVTEAHLAAITTLRVNAPPNQAVRPIIFRIGDFSGLTTLTNLEMERWSGVSLPDGIFDGLNALERVSLYSSGLRSIPNSVLGLTSLKSLNIGYHGITSIPAGVFDQLTQLNTLILDAAAYGNTFTSLPDGVFDKLTSLTYLNLDQNKITSLPDGVFDQLTSLESLSMARIHSLSSLPDGVFDQLTSLTSLSLQSLKPASLPDGIFSELSSLTFLDLSGGRLTSLPAGIFSGLSSLTSLYLRRNAVDPLPLTVSLETVGEGQFKAVAPTGAPFDIVLPFNVRNGSISGGANILTIPTGSLESASLTVTRTPGTTAAVTVDIGTLLGLPTDVNQYGTRIHQGYTLVKSDDLPLVVINRLESGITPVSERTLQVRDAIVAAVPGINSADDVTEAHLAAITVLNLNGRNITALKVGDFDGLTSLEELRLYNNQLTTLPEDIFDGLTALTTLRLYGNQLSTLPEDIFDELIALTTLQLGLNRFTTLPSSIFDGLTKLTDLRMIGNQFITLPDSIFDGLTALTTLYLGDNAVNPLPLTVSLEKVGEDGFKATAPTGAPFAIVLPISVTNGSISGGATTLTIPAGSVESEPLTITRTLGATYATTVNIGTLPSLPANHSGYTLVKSADLPLNVTEGDIADIFAFTMTVVRIPRTDWIGFHQAGPGSTRPPYGSLSRQTFNFKGITYTVHQLYYSTDSSTGRKNLNFQTSPLFPRGFELYLDSQQFNSAACNDFDGALWFGRGTNRWYNVDLNWSTGQTVRVRVVETTPIPPGPPTNLTATTDFKNVTLTWEPHVNTDPTSLRVEYYELRISDDGGTTWAPDWEDIEYSGSGEENRSSVTIGSFGRVYYTFSNDMEYTFEIRAKGGDGYGDAARVTLIMNGITPISERTSQVRDAIVAAVPGVNSANDVTEAHLAAITSLYLDRDNITTLKAGDFDGLTALTTLNLAENQLSTLPADIFDALTELRELQLQNNRLSTLPVGIFEGPSVLANLYLSDNQLTTLPAGIFDKQTVLRILNLEGNQLSTLPEGIFDKLTELNYLTLADNRLTTLPAGIFDGPSALYDISLDGNRFTTLPMGIFKMKASFLTLRGLYLEDNAVDPLPLTVSLEKVADSQFKAVAPAGATFDFVLQISVANGTINGGTTTLTIPKGSAESTPLTVTRTPGTTAAVSVDIRYPLPELPSNHSGYELVKSPDLPLEVISVVAVTTPDTGKVETAVNIPDPNLRTKIETALGNASGAPISAAEMATLTSLTAQDASISNLTGLETATNLTTLKLGNNTISDISALAGLTNLTELQLWDNSISNISAVAELTNLTHLYLWGNAISDISAVARLTNLTHLRLGENSISNISALAGLTNLTFLSVKENSISDISAVAGLTNLTELVIGNNAITNISAVAKLTNLVWLDAPNNSISDISAVANLTNLTSLMLTGNTISDISALTGLTKLIELYLEENSISDLSPLVTNTGLGNNTEIYVTGNPLSYPSIYTHIPALQVRDVYIDFDNRVATALVKISGDTQQGTPGAALAQPFVVEVRDTDSVAFAGVPMTFAITAGGGTLSVTSIMTSANGRAQSTLTLGSSAGTNTVRASVQGISQTETFTAVATTTNSAPTFTEGTSTTRTIAENTAAGVNIGAAIAATDADNDTLTYTLGGTDASSFSIVSSSGQLQTQAALDYETKRSYTVTITVSDGSLTDTITVTINITDVAETPVVPTLNLLSDRTPEVRDAIVAAVPGVNSANDVTEAHLAAITRLDLENKNISSLKDGDFDGMTALFELRLQNNRLQTLPANIFSDLSSLRTLYLNNNRLSSLPSTVFSGLSSLSNLYMNNNQLTSLPALVFSGLTSLRQINMHTNLLTTLPVNVFSGLSSLNQISINNNRLTSLPENVFSGRTGLIYLYLDGNRLTSLPANLFSGLSALEQLKFNNNRLSTLPAGLFRGLSSLTWLLVQGNTVNPLPFTVSLEKVGTNQFKATAPVGAPFAMTIPIPVVNGSISGGATTLTIPAGDVESAPLTVTRRLGTTDAVTVDFGNPLPGLPTQHQGYELVKSSNLPLTVINVLSNSAPVFTDGTSATRTIAENTASGVNIGSPVSATDANNDTLTYSLSGTDAASFDIDTTNGQLQTQAALDYETKSSYTVTVTVSDGDLTDTITVTVNITDIDELPTDAGVCKVGDILAPGESCTYPGTDATFSVLDNGQAQWNIPDLPAWLEWINQTSISGSLSISTTINGETYHFVAEELSSGSWEIKEIGDSGTQQPDPSEQPQPPVTESDPPTLSASTAAPLTEATLHEGVVTLTLNDGTYESSNSRIRNAVTASTDIRGVTVNNFDIDRMSDTQVTVELTFDGTDFDTNSTITFTVGAGAIADYDGTALTAQIPVSANTESVVATTAAPLTEDTLDGSVVTLTLSGRTYESSGVRIRNAVTVSGISGVTVGTFDIDRVSDTQVTVELTFDGTDFDTNSTLTFTVGTGAIAGYDGAALTAQVSVSATTEAPEDTGGQTPQQPGDVGGAPTLTTSTTAPLTETTLDESVVTLTLSGGTYHTNWGVLSQRVTVSGIDGVIVQVFNIERVSDTEVTVELTFDDTDFDTNSTLTFTVGAGAIANYDGTALTAQVPVTANTESVVASTTSPLTEDTLDGSVVTLTLSGRTYESSIFTIRDAVTVSGITGVTVGTSDIDRVSDTQVTVELTFNGNINTDSTLTFTVGADAIVGGYNGSALTSQVSVSAGDPPEQPQQPEGVGGTPTLSASTAAPLTEATLDESVITLTLSGRTYEQSNARIRTAVTISGIAGVTVRGTDIDRVSDTQVTVELTFDRNINTDGTLTFTVGARAIADYTGSALTTQIPVTAVAESVVATTAAPLTEATLDESVVTLTLNSRSYESSRSRIRDAVTVSGISGVTVGTFDIDRVSDTQVTVELTFNGNISTDSTLIFTVGPGAIAGYDGTALTAQVSVSASTEAPVVTDGQTPVTPQQPVTPEQPPQPENTGGTPTLSVTTASPLTEATLHGGIITLTLSGGTFRSSIFWIRNAVSVSGINGVTVESFGGERISNTQATIELEYDGNMTANGTLTISVGAGAIEDYDGAALTSQISVPAVTESVTASTDAPLTEATLDESVVTLTLSGRTYESFIFTISDAVSVSGISGVTVGTFDIDRESDTEITVELTFDGDITVDGTLTFTVGADAIAGYNGPALTAQVPVTATVQVLRAPSGISLMHVPLQVTAVDGVAQTIESVGDLYNALGGMNTVNLLITHNPKTQEWHSYLGESSRGTSADTILTDNQGIIADMKTPVSLQLDGNALGRNGSSLITLHPGTNLLGMPLQDSRITRVSDLLALEGIRDNASTITVLNNGTFQTVEQAGDVGDIPITGGQSFILNARETATVAISGQGWDNVSGIAAAAPMKLTGIEVGDTTPILALTGSIVSPAGGWGRIPHLRLGSGLRVIVKNLSTGRAVSTERRSAFPTVTGDEGVGYQLTVVDTETGQAARIGDILEISVRSPNPLIGVQPLRYTVTAEDVRRSRIQLPELTVYEIPAETELLRNYPNPFNPETWIPYRLAEDAFVTLTIYDTAGQVVRSIDVGYKPAAAYESRSKAIYWDGRNDFSEQVASGVYFYHLSTGDFSATRKMLILK